MAKHREVLFLEGRVTGHHMRKGMVYTDAQFGFHEEVLGVEWSLESIGSILGEIPMNAKLVLSVQVVEESK